MTDIAATIAQATVIASGDYKSADPADVVLKADSATAITVTVHPTALSGSGCTVTVSVTDADTDASLADDLVVTAQADSSVVVPIPRGTYRVQIACVGSGTRTTLTYSVKAAWADIAYGPNVIWDGSAYVNAANDPE